MDSDCEIEYLDEDAEIVQSCIETMKSTDIKHGVMKTTIKPPKKLARPRTTPTDAIKRKPFIQTNYSRSPEKRKWITRDDEDSDYQPNPESDDSDFEIGKPEYDPNRSRKKKPIVRASPQIVKKVKLTIQPQAQNRTPRPPGFIPKPEVVYLPPPPVSRTPASKNVAKQSNIVRIIASNNQQKAGKPQPDPKKFAQKLKMNPNISIKKVAGNVTPNKYRISIPARDVSSGNKTPNQHKIPARNLSSIQLKDYKDPLSHRGIKLTLPDTVKRQWNATCRAQAQRIQKTPAKSTKTVQTIRKTKQKTGGAAEQMTKLSLESRVDGKLERLVVTLPKLDTLDSFSVSFKDDGKNVLPGFKSCMLLTMEKGKDFEGLVAYNPKQQRITTYKEIKDRNGTSKTNGKLVEARMQMLMTCRMCVACYQYSWRGGKNNKPTGDMRCAICDGKFTSAYNLLSHLRSHELSPLQKRRQNALLAEIMPYHYICRICKFKTDCIPNLRRHVKKHKGTQPFICIVGNHLTT